MKFHLPTKPLSIVDAINRLGLATGSFGVAMASSNSDYNGHPISVSFNEYRQYYVAQYVWGDRVVIARGNCEDVLNAAIEFFGRQGRGASLKVELRDEDAGIAEALGLAAGDEARPAWRDWKFDEINEALLSERQLGIPKAAFLIQAMDENDYRERINAYIESRRRPIQAAA